MSDDTQTPTPPVEPPEGFPQHTEPGPVRYQPRRTFMNIIAHPTPPPPVAPPPMPVQRPRTAPEYAKELAALELQFTSVDVADIPTDALPLKVQEVR
ncbi:MAG: hypothetical protein ACI8UO_005491 [Verrucomicrobiales bacterium]|jgi:hypothetical protein